jgi:hypothetical protein
MVASETRDACSVDVDSIMTVRTMDRSKRWRTSLMVHNDGIVSQPLGVGCFPHPKGENKGRSSEAS